VQTESTGPIRVVKPTTGLVREFLVAKGTRPAQSRSKISVEDKVEYLKDHPDVARALASTLGIPVGTRGVISAQVFTQVAESL
jgi:hypothetical protein